MAEEKIKERIRRMLALAEDMGTTQEERDAAFARASALMTRHQIERSMIQVDNQRREVVTSLTIRHFNPYSKQKSNMLGWVAMALGMRVVNWGRQTIDKTVVYGFESDLEMLEMLYNSLLLQQTAGVNKAKPPYYLQGSGIAAWRRDWLTAFGTQVSYRVKNAHDREVAKFDREYTGATTTGAGLVLAKRTDQVVAYLEEQNPRLRKPNKSRPPIHRDAILSGMEAGERADIGGTRLGEKSSTRQLGG